MSVSRREFLAASLAAGPLAAAKSETGVPTRMLGKTGARVSILAFGGGSRFTMFQREGDKAAEMCQKALDLGITYIDTSDDYSNGWSEQQIGKALKAHGKKGVFVATKVSKRDGSIVRSTVERSIKNFGLDQLDLVHIHSLLSAEDLAKIEEKGGVLEELQKCKDAKLVRFIGITSHAAPVPLQHALERHDFDCTQMALNAAMTAMKSGRGMVPDPDVKDTFETTALPVAVRKKMGIIAMKVFAQDAMQGQTEASAKNLLYYALTLPITTAVVGFPKPEMLEEDIQLVKAFKPLPKAEMHQLSQKLAIRNKAALLEFFRNHVDA